MSAEYQRLCYDRNGELITEYEYRYLFQDETYRVLAQSTLDGGSVLVSTIWLGLWTNAPWPNTYWKPLIFETMILGSGFSEYQDRYHDEMDALIGHYNVVKAVQQLLGN